MNIKSERDYIINILEKVKAGKYLVPEFQRDFVWSPRQVMDLFDSIMKGYPIGSLILWQPESVEFKNLSELGGISILEHKSNDKLYVLDGRQRLTALLSVLYEGGDYYGSICINLDDGQILNAPMSRMQKPNYLCMGTAFDTYELVGFIDRLRRSNLFEEKKKIYAERAKSVNRKILSYELSYISVMGGSIDDAVEMFSRINSKNTKISIDYMLQALAYQPNSDFLFANEITRIKQKLSKFNFDRIDRGLILKCVYNYLDIPFIDGSEKVLLTNKSKLPPIMNEVSKDVYNAVEFLYKHCGLIDCKMLPYSYQFVMMALFFKNNRTPSEEQLHELVKWFFYTTYSGYFTNTSLAVIREDIKMFRDYAIGKTENPINYSPEVFDMRLPERIQLGSVRSCAMAAISVLNQQISPESTAIFMVWVLPDTGPKTWGNTFFLTNKKDIESIEYFLNSDDAWDDKFSKYALSENIVISYRRGQIDKFLSERKALMLQQESSMLRNLLGVNMADKAIGR